uniref:Ribosomal protein S19 n=1 Tax=Romanomermis culicivorax TaxID=13658 RepID=A0A915IUM0_ROMCU
MIHRINRATKFLREKILKSSLSTTLYPKFKLSTAIPVSQPKVDEKQKRRFFGQYIFVTCYENVPIAGQMNGFKDYRNVEIRFKTA